MARIALNQVRARGLTTMLAMDVSGSMKSQGKIDQARKAGSVFLSKTIGRWSVGFVDPREQDCSLEALSLPTIGVTLRCRKALSRAGVRATGGGARVCREIFLFI